MESTGNRSGSRELSFGRYGGWIASAVSIAWALFFYREILFDDRVYVFRDMHAFILPMNHTGQLLGQWGWPPLWNPLQSLGKPFAADIQNAVYYPITWMLRGLPQPLAFNLNLAVHHILAAAGMYLLLRRWRAALPSCVLGALLFAFGGLMIAFDNMANALQSTVWLPWAILFFDRWLDRRDAASIAGLAVAIGLTVLGAMPEVLLFANAALVTIAWDRRSNPDGPGLAQSFGAILIANVTAFGLCAAQLIPFLEYVRLSSRAAGLTTEAATRFSLEPESLFGFFLPRRLTDATGAFSETAAAWEAGNQHLPWAITLYFGIALILVPAAWSSLTRRRALLWCGFGVFFTALAFGHHTPGYAWLLEQIPTLRSLRYPEKFLVLVHTGLAVAAAFGLEQCLRRNERYTTVAFAGSAVAVTCTIAAAVLFNAGGFASQVWASDLLALGACGAVLTVVAFGGRRAPRAAAMAIIALVAADLYRATSDLLPTLPYSAFSAPPRSLAAMQMANKVSTTGNSPLRIYSNASGRKAVRVFPESVIQEHELMLGEQASFHGVANLYGPASINLADHEELELMLVSSRRDRVSRLLSFFNTAYLTSQRELQYEGLTLLQSSRNDIEANVYRIEDVRERAFVAPQLVALEDKTSALDYLYKADAPEEHVAVIAALPAGMPERAIGRARIVSYLPDRVELEASMQTPGLVVLSDSYYDGWRATVNGEPSEIVRANIFARGVFVASGEQRIVYEFAPLSHRLGRLGSLLTAVLAIAAVVLDARRRR